MIPKFRAWDKLTNKMFPVVIIGYYIPLVCIEEPNGMYAERDFDEIELMQFTGLKDKNGKEIFEGDIIKFSIDNGFCYGVDEIGSVSYRLGAFHVDVFPLIDLIGDGEVEVVGNVYETQGLQDLLKD